MKKQGEASSYTTSRGTTQLRGMRNAQLETLHAELTHTTRTCENPGVFVHGADGRRISWTEDSSID